MKGLFILLPIASTLTTILKPMDAYELIGVWIATGYLSWNIYAYLNRKKMFSPLDHGVDLSATGSRPGRALLAATCLIAYIIIISAVIVRGE